MILQVILIAMLLGGSPLIGAVEGFVANWVARCARGELRGADARDA